jgi:hypothetical protein
MTGLYLFKKSHHRSRAAAWLTLLVFTAWLIHPVMHHFCLSEHEECPLCMGKVLPDSAPPPSVCGISVVFFEYLSFDTGPFIPTPVDPASPRAPPVFLFPDCS